MDFIPTIVLFSELCALMNDDQANAESKQLCWFDQMKHKMIFGFDFRIAENCLFKY